MKGRVCNNTLPFCFANRLSETTVTINQHAVGDKRPI